MGIPVIGGTTTGSVTEDSGLIVTGDLDDVGFLSGNNDDTWSISVSATYGTATINPTTGTWSYDLDDSNPIVDALDDGDTLTDVFTVLMVDSNGQSDTQDVTITITGVVCFVAGTMIECAEGPRRIEDLHAGDRVRTLDHGLRPLSWIGRIDVTAEQIEIMNNLRPIRICKGALGDGYPNQDLFVSRQHRILITGPAAARYFGFTEILLPACKLLGLPGISVDNQVQDISYFHLLLEEHEVVFANGAPAESFLLGAESVKTLTHEQLTEISSCPDHTDVWRANMRPARPVPKGGPAIKTFVQHLKSAATPPLDAWSALV